jgi:manganese transport protein
VSKWFQIALGILAAIGGFVDIGDLVFTTQAGAVYRYDLLWAVVVGVVGIIFYAEMSGRVAAVTKRPVMNVVRERMGVGWGVVALVAGQVVTIATLAAELGGIGVVLNLAFDVTQPAFIVLGALVLVAVMWVLPFGWIEKVFGYGGLLLLVYLAATFKVDTDWGDVARGFVPHFEGSSEYAFFVVGLVAAALMPYEVYFYSSGAVEDGWSKRDLGLNRANSVLGYGIGALLSVALIVTTAGVFAGAQIQPSTLGSTAMAAQVPFGEIGLLLALGGILFAVSGAAIDTAFAGAYNFSQFWGWEWGKHRRPSGAPRFTVAWVILVVVATMLIVTGLDPVVVTEYAVIFSVVALPLTYLPVLLVARDATYMGEHRNGRVASLVGWVYMAVIAVIGVAAIPLLLATTGG